MKTDGWVMRHTALASMLDGTVDCSLGHEGDDGRRWAASWKDSQPIVRAR